MIVEKHTKNEEKQTEADMINLDETSETLQGYEMVSLDAGLWMNQGATNPNSCSPSFSLEESLNPTMGESNPIQQWVDSMLSCDGFNQLEEVLLFLKNCQ